VRPGADAPPPRPAPLWDMVVPFLLGVGGIVISFWAASQWPSKL
jgi:hypothetical protein